MDGLSLEELLHRKRERDDAIAQEVQMELPGSRAAAQRAAEAHQRFAEQAYQVAAEPVEAEREAGQHGGGASGGADQSGVGSATGPEAVPQRDDPDDGEHVGSEPEPDPVEQQSADDDDPFVSEPEPEEPQPADEPEPEPQEEQPEPVEEAGQAQIPARIPDLEILGGGEVPALSWTKGMGFKIPGESKQVRAVPESLLLGLRALLRPFGEEFAEEISAGALVSAFLAAKLGIALETDANTSQAVRAFRLMEPGLSAVEDRLTQIAEDMSRLVRNGDAMLRTTRGVERGMESVTLAQAWLVADRVELVGQREATAAGVDYTQPKVLATLENLREQSSDVRREARVKDGVRRS